MIIKSDPELIISYTGDESGLRGGFADKVFVPENEKEIREILKSCSADKVPVTVSGGGTGVTGGRVPFGGAVISMERFNSAGEIRTLSPDAAEMTAGAGVTIKEIKEKAKAAGWMYGPDPTEQGSFLGGNISTNASGSRGLKFGPTRNYIKRIKVTLSDGETLDIERGKTFAGQDNKLKIPAGQGVIELRLPTYKLPEIKNAAGYFNKPGMDLIDLFIGHEGTLGVITEADVALMPDIKKILTGIAFFTQEIKSREFVRDVKRASAVSRRDKDAEGIDAMSLEYFDLGALDLLKDDYCDIPKGTRSAIFFEQSVSEEGNDVVIDKWANELERHGVNLGSVWFGTTEREEKLFREFRHRLPEKVNEIVRRNKFPKTGTDLAVPEDRQEEMINFYVSELESSGIRYLIFGHIGESHMHANFLPDNEKDYAKSRDIYLKLAKKAVSLGGTVSAEHGIGKLKHVFLEAMVGKAGVLEMVRLKKTLDPSGILGRGNIFDEKLL